MLSPADSLQLLSIQDVAAKLKRLTTLPEFLQIPENKEFICSIKSFVHTTLRVKSSFQAP